MDGGREKLRTLLTTRQDELLDRWVARQLDAATLRPDLLSERELREESRRVLGLLAEAVTGGAEQMDELRAVLGEISTARAYAGFSPRETATFVFSLKEPLFEALADEGGDALWAVSTILDELGLHTFDAFLTEREKVIGRQSDELLELSTPVMRVWRGVLVLPLIGTLDSARGQAAMEALLEEIVATESHTAIIDITGVPTVDTLVAQHLLKAVAAAQLMGATCLISGIRPQIAQTIVHLGVDLKGVETKPTLAAALAAVLRRVPRATDVDPDAVLPGDGDGDPVA